MKKNNIALLGTELADLAKLMKLTAETLEDDSIPKEDAAMAAKAAFNRLHIYVSAICSFASQVEHIADKLYEAGDAR